MAVQIGVDLLLGALACVQMLGLVALGRTQDAGRILVSHGSQLNLLAASGMTLGMFLSIAFGFGLL